MADWFIIFAPCRTPEADDGSESLVALRIGPKTAKVTTIPIWAEGVCRGDFVEFDEDFVVVEVLERAARRRRATFDEAGDGTRARWRLIRDYLRRWDIIAGPDPDRGELALPGILLMAVPRDISDDRLVDIAVGSPVPLVLLREELKLTAAP